MMLCNFKKNLKRHCSCRTTFPGLPRGNFEFEFSMIWRMFCEFEFQEVEIIRHVEDCSENEEIIKKVEIRGTIHFRYFIEPLFHTGLRLALVYMIFILITLV